MDVMQKNNTQGYETLPLWQCAKCHAINTKLNGVCDACGAPYDVLYGYRLWKLVARYYDSLFITMNGDVWCDNADRIIQNEYIVDASVGFKHKLFLTLDGKIIATGSNQHGQLNVPQISSKCVAVSAGKVHSVALTEQGDVYAWGSNQYYQIEVGRLYNNVSDTHMQRNVEDFNTNNFSKYGGEQQKNSKKMSDICCISAGHFHTMVLNHNGEVRAWGDNRYGQCAIPKAAQTDVIAIAAGGNHSLVLRADGSVVAWGEDFCGECVVPVNAINITQIAAGYQYSMALTNDGRVIVWGNRNMMPVQINTVGNEFVSIAAGEMHALAQQRDGTIVGWGTNEYRQIMFNGPDYIERYVKRVTARPDYVQEQANEWRNQSVAREEKIKKTVIDREELEAARLKEMQVSVKEMLKSLCQNDFLAVDIAFNKQDVLLQSELRTIKTAFLRKWFEQYLPDGATQPDDDQLNAIGSVHGNVQVIARAGSGKTSTLVYRVFFLIKHCRVQANEIMMLAFNRKAAHEMRERLLRLLYPKVIPEYEQFKRERRAKTRRNQIDEVAISQDALTHLRTGKEIPLPFIMTFHGLVHNIVHPSETIIYDTRDPEGAIQSKTLQSLIDEHIRDYDAQGHSIRQLMLQYFRDEWIDIEDNKYGLSKAEFLEYRRSIVNLSLQGHPVKSYGEKKIADFLFSHNVDYKYESDIVIGNVQYRPDFSIWKDKKRIVIEYAGLQGNTDYDELFEQKRNAYHSQKNLELIELTPDHIKDTHTFEQQMYAILERNDISFRQLDDDEIWELIKDRAVGSFSRLMNGFIQKCRQLLISPADLNTLILTHQSLTKGNLEVEFAKLARTIYQEYIDYCDEYSLIDFSTLMQRATHQIREGKSDFSKRHSHGNITQTRFLSIDEFQDFSLLFYELLSAMRGMNPTMQLFCVGDDWQAINRFAGADTRYFTDFERYIGPRTVCHITSNYRSAQRIVELGNAVMQGRGVPAKVAQSQSGLIVMVYIDDFVSNDKESEYFGRYRYDFAALSRLLYVHAYYKNNVTVLSRTSAPLEDVFPKIRKLFMNVDEVKLLHSTTHGYKGLEQESIILWNVTEQQYPMIHAQWIFGRILGDTLEQIIEDERRLFYVGVTRASKKLYIVTRRQSMSPFLVSAISGLKVKELAINTLIPVDTLASSDMIIRLTGDTYPVKDAIKQHNYKWNQSLKVWEKTTCIDDFSPEILACEAWLAQANNITVTCVDETGTILQSYLVDAGKMTEISSV